VFNLCFPSSLQDAVFKGAKIKQILRHEISNRPVKEHKQKNNNKQQHATTYQARDLLLLLQR